METVELLHYKWCLCNTDSYIYNGANYIIINDTFDRELVCCKVEKWTKYDDTGVIKIIGKSGVRTVPVKRSEMETI